MKNGVLIVLAALMVGGAVGYLAGSGGLGREESKETAVRPGKGGGKPFGGGLGVGPVSPRSGSGGEAKLREILGEPGQTNRILSLLEYYAELDPSRFAEEVKNLEGLPMSQRMLAMNLLFARWAEVDPEGALEESRKVGFPEMFMARAGVLQGWAASDPKTLAREYAENPSRFRMGRRGGREAVNVIASEWAKQNPAAALEWARSLDGGEAGRAIEGVFQEVSQQDPKRALELAAGLAGEERLEAYRSIAEAWAVQDWDATASWLSSLTGEEQAAAWAEAVESLASVDPQRAANEALKLPAGEQRESLVAEVSREWAREDAAAALEWLTTQGGEEAQEEGVGRVVAQLTRENPEAARDWIEGEPIGEVRDNAVRGYIMSSRGEAPAESVALAETISDTEARERLVERVVYRWIRDDAEAASSYIQSSATLSEERKERLLEAAESGGEGGGGFRGGR